MWAQIAQVVVSMAIARAGNRAAQELAAIQTDLSAFSAQKGNQIRQASNAAEAAQNNLARYVQSVNNNRALDAGGNAQEALTVNYMRGRDQGVQRGFSQDIREAEQAGGMAAAAASAGVDGNVVDMVNQSTALRDSIIGQQVQDATDAADHDFRRRSGNIMSQMVSSLDNSLILDSLDYTREFATNTPAPSSAGAMFQSALSSVSSMGGGMASMFGGSGGGGGAGGGLLGGSSSTWSGANGGGAGVGIGGGSYGGARSSSSDASVNEFRFNFDGNSGTGSRMVSDYNYENSMDRMDDAAQQAREDDNKGWWSSLWSW